MRDRKVIPATKEEIVEYSWSLGGLIRVLVAYGELVDGNFVPSPGQTYESYELSGVDFTNVMNPRGDKPANTFKKEDLWEDIDKLRTRSKSG